MPWSADTLLLSLFVRQARVLVDRLSSRGLQATPARVADWIVGDACRHIMRVRLHRDMLRLRLEQQLSI